MQKKGALLIRIRVGKRYPFAEPVYSANGKLAQFPSEGWEPRSLLR